jgi:hypothetical protein
MSSGLHESPPRVRGVSNHDAVFFCSHHPHTSTASYAGSIAVTLILPTAMRKRLQSSAVIPITVAGGMRLSNLKAWDQMTDNIACDWAAGVFATTSTVRMWC